MADTKTVNNLGFPVLDCCDGNPSIASQWARSIMTKELTMIALKKVILNPKRGILVISRPEVFLGDAFLSEDV